MAGEKRSQDKEESIINENVIIIDIEGTTTSISFVKDNLFPYVRENVKKYIDSKWEDNEFKNVLEKLKEQAKKDEEDKTEGVIPISGSTVDEEKESLVKNVLWQMDGDRKSGALKQLQGHIWREAYDSGKIKGHVYEDVPESLKSWKNIGKKVYVYSSGSVEAQKLLFGHTEHGDLLEYFSGHFDTAVGPKQEAESYKNILSQIKAEASDVIFLTDIVKEAKAAKEAGLSTIIMIRDGNAPLTADETVEFRTAKSFLDLSFMNPAKRQKLQTPEDSDKPKTVDTVTEKVEVSGDVEMKDVSDIKDSKSNVDTKEAAKPEIEASKDVVAEEKTQATETVDEAMETDGKTVEAKKEIEETKSVDEPKKEAEETAEKIVEKEIEAEIKIEKTKADETDADVKKTEAKDTTEKKSEAEDKTETKTAEEDKTEGSEPSTNDKIENQTESKKSTEITEETKEKVEKIEPKKSENVVAEEESEKAKQKSEEIEQPKETVTENGTSKVDGATKTDDEVKEAETKKTAEVTVDKNESKDDEAKKEEVKKVEETKDEKEPEIKSDEVKTEAAEPAKKLNGTTQNGENGNNSDKIHTNGVNEPCTSDTNVTTKSTEVSSPQQTRESESSTNDASSDSIKVKKVVDSTPAADGAGEQDVVTPAVVVAATS